MFAGFSVHDWLALCGEVGAVFASIASVIGAVRSFGNASQLRSVRVEIDGRFTELLESRAGAAFLAGAERGRVTAVAEHLAGVAAATERPPSTRADAALAVGVDRARSDGVADVVPVLGRGG